MLIKDLMHKRAITCQEQDSLDQVGLLMWNEDCGAIPVLDDDGKIKGMITDRDIAMAAVLKHRPLWDIPAHELIAGKSIHCCLPEDDIHDVLKLMAEYRIRRMPVVDAQKRMMGMVATKDLMEHIQSKGGHGKADDLSPEETVSALQQICKPNALKVAA